MRWNLHAPHLSPRFFSIIWLCMGLCRWFIINLCSTPNPLQCHCANCMAWRGISRKWSHRSMKRKWKRSPSCWGFGFHNQTRALSFTSSRHPLLLWFEMPQLKSPTGEASYRIVIGFSVCGWCLMMRIRTHSAGEFSFIFHLKQLTPITCENL